MLDKYIASVTAVLEPPTTITSLSLKKYPSQLAQKLMPLPINFSSFYIFNLFSLLPVAIIIYLVFIL